MVSRMRGTGEARLVLLGEEVERETTEVDNFTTGLEREAVPR